MFTLWPFPKNIWQPCSNSLGLGSPNPWPSVDPYVVTELCVTHLHDPREMQTHLLSPASRPGPCKTLVKVACIHHPPAWCLYDTSPAPAPPRRPQCYRCPLCKYQNAGSPGLCFMTSPVEAGQPGPSDFHLGRPEHTPIEQVYTLDPLCPVLDPALSRRWLHTHPVKSSSSSDENHQNELKMQVPGPLL